MIKVTQNIDNKEEYTDQTFNNFKLSERVFGRNS